MTRWDISRVNSVVHDHTAFPRGHINNADGSGGVSDTNSDQNAFAIRQDLGPGVIELSKPWVERGEPGRHCAGFRLDANERLLFPAIDVDVAVSSPGSDGLPDE